MPRERRSERARREQQARWSTYWDNLRNGVEMGQRYRLIFTVVHMAEGEALPEAGAVRSLYGGQTKIDPVLATRLVERWQERHKTRKGWLRYDTSPAGTTLSMRAAVFFCREEPVKNRWGECAP